MSSIKVVFELSTTIISKSLTGCSKTFQNLHHGNARLIHKCVLVRKPFVHWATHWSSGQNRILINIWSALNCIGQHWTVLRLDAGPDLKLISTVWLFKSGPVLLLCQSWNNTRSILDKRLWLDWPAPLRVENCLRTARRIWQSKLKHKFGRFVWFPG